MNNVITLVAIVFVVLGFPTALLGWAMENGTLAVIGLGCFFLGILWITR